MPLQIKNTSQLLDPNTFKMKVLLYALPGTGKTEWASTSINPGFAACETGEGNGVLTLSRKNIDYVEPATYADFESICGGHYFKDKDTIVIDSLSDMCRTFIKDYALAVPRAKGNSDKRRMGVPELDDYGVMGELTRRLLRKLLDLDKHIVVTATVRYDKPDPETGQGQLLVGPDLPGQLFLGSAAMFDFVLCLKTRMRKKDPQDPKSRYAERYLLTQPDETHIVKCRPRAQSERPLLDSEEVFEIDGRGSFTDLYKKVLFKSKEVAANGTNS